MEQSPMKLMRLKILILHLRQSYSHLPTGEGEGDFLADLFGREGENIWDIPEIPQDWKMTEN